MHARGFYNSVLEQLPTVPISEETLLGAPLFQGPALDQSWSKRCDDLVRAMNRLKHISSQDALIF